MAIWEFNDKSTEELETLRDIIFDIEECGIQQCEEMKDALEVELCERSTTFESKNIPAEDRYGREPDKVKPLAQYLDEYIEYEVEAENILSLDDLEGSSQYNSFYELFEQALDAYESTENVKIRIERV